VPATVLWRLVFQASKQVSGLLLSRSLGSLCLQQLPWLLESHAPTQVDPRVSAALWAPYDSSLPNLLLHGHPQLATQCQGPAATHVNETQALHFGILLVPGGFPPYRKQRPSTNHQALQWESPHFPIKEQEPSSSTEW
jgi:hypothetical protein